MNLFILMAFPVSRHIRTNFSWINKHFSPCSDQSFYCYVNGYWCSVFFPPTVVSIGSGHFFPDLQTTKCNLRLLYILPVCNQSPLLPARQRAPALNSQFRGQVATSLKRFSGFYHFMISFICVPPLPALCPLWHEWTWSLSARSDSLCRGRIVVVAGGDYWGGNHQLSKHH